MLKPGKYKKLDFKSIGSKVKGEQVTVLPLNKITSKSTLKKKSARQFIHMRIALFQCTFTKNFRYF